MNGNDWGKFLTIALELIGTATVITVAFFLINLGHVAGQQEQVKVSQVEQMKEYREQNKWDNGNKVYYQDIVELMLNKQNSVQYRIDKVAALANSGTLNWGTNVAATNYTRNNLRTQIEQQGNVYYRATLIRDANDPGIVLGYHFSGYVE